MRIPLNFTICLMLGAGLLCFAKAGDDSAAFPGTKAASVNSADRPDSPAVNNRSDAPDSGAYLRESGTSEKRPVMTVHDSAASITPIIAGAQTPLMRTGDSLGGNLPRVIEARAGPYRVTSDIYVPSGKTVTIKPGVVMLFKNFTELHIEGCLIAEGTFDRPIVFTSEFDTSFNPRSTLLANPYDWNGIFIHENGLGSSFSHCKVHYTVYGINSLTKYIKIDQVMFRGNGRCDLSIEGKKQPVTDKPYSYALTIADAKKDGVPVAILMDPMAKKRNAARNGGFGLLAGGLTMGVWSIALLTNDQHKLDQLSDRNVIDGNSALVSQSKKDWNNAADNRNRDRWLIAASGALAVIGGAGFTLSFRF